MAGSDYLRTATYLGIVDAYAACPDSPGATVFLGDSLIGRLPWCEWWPGTPVLNRGIAGDELPGTIGRTAEVQRHDPRVVVVEVGINDLLLVQRTAADMLIDYGILLERLEPLRVVVCGLLPLNAAKAVGFGVSPEILAKMAGVNAGLGALSDGRTVRYWDPLPTFGIELDPRYTRDGLHLNGAGYRVWVEALGPYVEWGRR